MTKFIVPPKEFMRCHRFFNRTKRGTYKQFKDSYVQNVRDENSSLLEHIKKIETKVALLAAKVTLREEKVQEAKCEEKKANVQLRSLKDKMIALMLGEDDPAIIEWNCSMALTTTTKCNNVKVLRN